MNFNKENNLKELSQENKIKKEIKEKPKLISLEDYFSSDF